MDKTDWLIIAVVLAVMCMVGITGAMTKREFKTTIEKDIEFATKIYKCMYYCGETYKFDDCRNGCFFRGEKNKGGKK